MKACVRQDLRHKSLAISVCPLGHSLNGILANLRRKKRRRLNLIRRFVAPRRADMSAPKQEFSLRQVIGEAGTRKVEVRQRQTVAAFLLRRRRRCAEPIGS